MLMLRIGAGCDSRSSTGLCEYHSWMVMWSETVEQATRGKSMKKDNAGQTRT